MARNCTIVDRHDFRRRIQFCFTYNPGSAAFLDLTVSNVAGPRFSDYERWSCDLFNFLFRRHWLPQTNVGSKFFFTLIAHRRTRGLHANSLRFFSCH
jgi:hypothetical protein